MTDLFCTTHGRTSDQPDAPYSEAGEVAPFRIFIPNARAYLAGDFATRREAQMEADEINCGAYAP